MEFILSSYPIIMHYACSSAVQSSGPVVNDCTDRRVKVSFQSPVYLWVWDHPKMSASRNARLESNSQCLGMNKIKV